MFKDTDLYVKKNRDKLEYLDTKPETVKFLDKNIGANPQDIVLGNDFLHMTPKAQATKTKIDKWDCIKLKSFCTAKEINNRVKRKPTKWKKYICKPYN